MTCTCPHLHLGMETLEQRNWNPDCLEHGVDSAYYKRPEQVERRKKQNERLRDLQAQARAARKAQK